MDEEREREREREREKKWGRNRHTDIGIRDVSSPVLTPCSQLDLTERLVEYKLPLTSHTKKKHRLKGREGDE